MAEATPIWDFHVNADLLSDGHYRVRVETRSGKKFERVGYRALWELIRIIGNAQSTPIGKEAENEAHTATTPQASQE